MVLVGDWVEVSRLAQVHLRALGLEQAVLWPAHIAVTFASAVALYSLTVAAAVPVLEPARVLGEGSILIAAPAPHVLQNLTPNLNLNLI